MQGLISAAAGSDWSYGGSILTFAFPMILFITVASALYVLYTKPHIVPGHRYRLEARAATATGGVKVPGQEDEKAGGAEAGGTEGTQ